MTYLCRDHKTSVDWFLSHQKEIVSTLFLKRIKCSPSQQLPTWDFKQICMECSLRRHPGKCLQLPCSPQRPVYLSLRPFQLNFKEGFRGHVMTSVLQSLLNHNTRNQKGLFLFPRMTCPPCKEMQSFPSSILPPQEIALDLSVSLPTPPFLLPPFSPS